MEVQYLVSKIIRSTLRKSLYIWHTHLEAKCRVPRFFLSRLHTFWHSHGPLNFEKQFLVLKLFIKVSELI